MLPLELTGVCRLCLMKDQVEVNIFENDSKDIYYRISTCLPVTVTVEDKLPKKICLTCLNKINMFYDFWNQTLNTEKHLLSWLNLEPATSNNMCKNSQPYSYSCISENNDNDINNHSTNLDSDDNNVESDLENSVDRCTNNMKSEDCNEPKSNLILNVDYQDEKPGPSGFQVEQTSALKQLQGLGEELIYLYVESEQQESNHAELLPPIEKYSQPTSNQFSLLFDNDLDRHSAIEIEDSSHIDISKSNIEQTSSYSVEFPQSDRSHDEPKFPNRKRLTKYDSSGNSSFMCTICHTSFTDKTDYYRHELIHYVDYPYECTLCGDHFKRFKQLENHKMYHHNVKELSSKNNSKMTYPNDTKSDRCSVSEMKKLTYEICSGKKTRLPIKDSSETSQNYDENDEFLVISRKRAKNDDVFVCETCGQKCSTSNLHKCSKPKPTSL